MPYPSLPIMRESTRRVLGGVNSQRATNGMLRTRRLYAAPVTEFTLVHWIDASGKATLDAHYSTYADLTDAFTWPGEAPVQVRYLEAPQYQPQNGWFIATVQLAQVS